MNTKSNQTAFHTKRTHVILAWRKEAALAGIYKRHLTQDNMEKHLGDFGLGTEFASHCHIRILSGGRKVEVVLGFSTRAQVLINYRNVVK